MNERYRWNDEEGRSRGAAPAGQDAASGPEPVQAGQDDPSGHRQTLYSGSARTAEGGFEPRGAFREWDQSALERDQEPRSWWARAGDEVRAWMGDREAARRVRDDQAQAAPQTPGGGDWKGHDDDTGWRDPLTDADAKPGPDIGVAPREHRPGLFRDDRGPGDGA